MLGAMSGLFKVIQFLQMLLFYAILAVIILMLYKVTKEVGDLKRSLTDMEERIMLALLPREAKPDKAERM
jgi:Ca2+/Na+ antiporter